MTSKRYSRTTSFYVSMPIRDYRAICNKIRQLNSSIYKYYSFSDDSPVPESETESDGNCCIIDDDGRCIGEWFLEKDPDSTNWDRNLYTSDQLPELIHRIGRGVMNDE